MDVILNLISYLGTPTAIFFLLIVIFLLVLINLYGEEFVPTITHKRNRFWSTIWAAIAIITLGVITIPRTLENLPVWLNTNHSIWIVYFNTYELIQTIFLIVLILYSINYIYNCKGNSFFARKYLKSCDEQICDGALIEVGKKILSKPWYFIRKADENAYYLLLCKYYIRMHRPIDGIKVANKVITDRLYQDSFERYAILIITAYIQVGAYSKAEYILKQLEKADKKNDCKDNAEYWNLKCFIEDSKGNLENSLECAQHGLDVAKEEEHRIRCQLNNNIARVLSLRLDTQNALYQMRWAKQQLDQMEKPDMFLVNVVYGNLILMLVRIDLENPEIEDLRASYYNLIEKYGNIENYIQYQNVILEMFRQSGINAYYPIVINGYLDIVKRLKEKYGDKINQERVAYEVSTLRILVNGNFTLKDIVKDITHHFKFYKTIDKKEMLFAYQELYGSIEQMHIVWQPHFSEIFYKIKKYYEKDGLDDVDKIIADLDEYDVYGYVNWLRRKGHILKAIYGKKSYPYTEAIHKALIEKCHREGLYKEELRERMLWLDDMTSPEVWGRDEKKPKLIIDNTKLVDKAAELYEHYKEYPDVYEFTILLSALYLILDDMEKSKKYLQDFIALNVDIHSYAAWYRLKYYHLLEIHGMPQKIDQADFFRVIDAGASSIYAKDMRLAEKGGHYI